MKKNGITLDDDTAEAVMRGDIASLEGFLNRGGDVNASVNRSGRTMLMHAAEEGKTETVRFLLQSGADVNRVDKKERKSALLLACWEGQEEIVNLLLEHGADVNHKKKGDKTALMYAGHSGKAGIVKMLLERGADPNLVNDEGQNALMYTSNSDKNIGAARELVLHGANINLPDKEGKTALAWAANYGSVEILKLLLEHGGNVGVIDSFGFNVLNYAKQAGRNKTKVLELLKGTGVKRLPFCYGYSIQIDCPHCGLPLAVNGPIQRTKCGSCQSPVDLGFKFWEGLFDTASDESGSSTVFGGNSLKVDYRRMNPVCPSCKTGISSEEVPIGTDGTHACPMCGAAFSTFPAPEWMEDISFKGRTPLQIFCAQDRDTEETEPPAGEVQSIVVRCASCGAGLSIDMASGRSVKCGHCGTTQILSDSVWLALHPVGKRAWWYIRFGPRKQ